MKYKNAKHKEIKRKEYLELKNDDCNNSYNGIIKDVTGQLVAYKQEK